MRKKAQAQPGSQPQSEKEVWQANSGSVAWPTVVLALVAAGAHLALFALHALGLIGNGLALTLATVVAYIGFTPLHEAAHGNIAGRNKRLHGLETSLGWLGALQLAAPYPAFRVLHLQHHSHTNHETRDPDMWVSARGTSSVAHMMSLVARCFTLLAHYYFSFFIGAGSRTKAVQRERTKVIVAFSMMLLAAGAAAWFGLASTLLFVWILPAWLATAVLGLLFDWLPHRPHDTQGRYIDTRAIDAPLGIPMLGQHLHLVHHLYPRVPFYRYRKVFDSLRPVLEEKGARIDSLGATPVETLADVP